MRIRDGMRGSGRLRPRTRGVTYIELLVAFTVLAVLASLAMPLARWDEKRRREVQLRSALETIRAAIDQYKKYFDEGLIQQDDVLQMGYPKDLEQLLEGVEVTDPTSAERRVVKFLYRVPVDPFTESADWGMRSYQDDWDSESWGGENVWDVYSLSPLRALDGTYYREW